ncbi:cytochrome P450 [Crucibulum laeve]|uniref:Cytochrome P450 n=1 Tax=Crucibulum laeve TaxID=68775 RepID=A0A5C3LUT7_9AGAR|nr:cytochrome P450 [Crucibulum laeve]
MHTSIACAVVIFLLSLWRVYLRRNRFPLPPGPPADPIIGHLLLIPSNKQADFFYNLSLKYGGVTHLCILGQTIIVLNTVQAAVDLLEKRGSIYSDRPKFTIFELMGWNAVLTFLPYGKQFQKHRTLIQDYFSRKKCESYQHYQIEETRVLLHQLSENPKAYDDHLKRFATGIIMQTCYGYEVKSDNDIFLKIAKDAMETFNKCGSPGSTMVDLFPFLQYLPYWVPGTYYARKAKEFQTQTTAMYEFPFRAVQTQVEGCAKPSYLSHRLEALNSKESVTGEEWADIKGSTATIYAAGTESTASTLAIFVLAMVLYPEYQIKAQREIDHVVGKDRLPIFEERPNLPFLECILQETYRWHNALPEGVPHRAMEDDVYNGMFIPKGAIIIANTRGMSLDSSVYSPVPRSTSDAHIFNPLRFRPKPLGLGEPYPIAHFGFRRRICPGKHLADASIWIAIASILSMFSLSKVVNDDGVEITPEVVFTAGLASRPEPVDCKIHPRNLSALEALFQDNS